MSEYTSGDQESSAPSRSTVTKAVEQFAEVADAPDDHTNEFIEVFETFVERTELVEEHNELLQERIDHLEQETVHAVAVERVLFEYGITGRQLDEIVADIEAVDSRLWGDDDE